MVDLIVNSHDDSSTTLVVFLCDEEKRYDGIIDNERSFKVDYTNFTVQMTELAGKINVKMLESTKYTSSKSLTQKVSSFLISLKISPKHLGFTYLKDAIVYCLANRGVVGNLQSDVYLSISAKYETSVYSIERSIRIAIDHAWKIKKEDMFSLSKKPSNKEFIAIVVNMLVYDQMV
jgi:hypothetical protein